MVADPSAAAERMDLAHLPGKVEPERRWRRFSRLRCSTKRKSPKGMSIECYRVLSWFCSYSSSFLHPVGLEPTKSAKEPRKERERSVKRLARKVGPSPSNRTKVTCSAIHCQVAQLISRNLVYSSYSRNQLFKNDEAFERKSGGPERKARGACILNNALNVEVRNKERLGQFQCVHRSFADCPEGPQSEAQLQYPPCKLASEFALSYF